MKAFINLRWIIPFVARTLEFGGSLPIALSAFLSQRGLGTRKKRRANRSEKRYVKNDRCEKNSLKQKSIESPNFILKACCFLKYISDRNTKTWDNLELASTIRRFHYTTIGSGEDWWLNSLLSSINRRQNSPLIPVTGMDITLFRLRKRLKM